MQFHVWKLLKNVVGWIHRRNQMEHKSFKVGDRVVVVHPEDNFKTVGLTGTVVYIVGNHVGVQHDEPFLYGHGCDGRSIDGCGLWYSKPKSQLRIIVDLKNVRNNLSDIFLGEE